MKHKYFRFVVTLLLSLLASGVSYSQASVRVMRIHYNDGAVEEVPVAMMDSITFDYNVGNDIRPVVNDSVTSNEVLERAYKMANLEWTPLRPVPRRDGNYYPAGVTVMGVPYSEVKEINTYLFQDVSYHTFMTAVHSPRSVLYTVDISRPPFNGTYCATYYGAVCSSSVMWALGIDIPYYTDQIINMPELFSMNEQQVIDSLKVCDVIWKSGHVQMIYDLEYNADTLYRIITFESAGYKAHFNNYTKTQFLNIWNSNGYVAYRYKKLKYSSEPVVSQQWDPIVYNDFLCPSKGDKSVYRTLDTVTIHIYDSSYSQIVLAKGSTLVSLDDYSGDSIQYYDLQPGLYKVFLQREGERTASVSFEVIMTNTRCTLSDDGESITIFFDSSALPRFAALCTRTGYSEYYPISNLDRWRGYISVPRSVYPAYKFCKVLFKGEYGNIISPLMSLE